MRKIKITVERQKATRAWYTWLTGRARWEKIDEVRTFGDSYRDLDEAMLYACMYPVKLIEVEGDWTEIMSIEDRVWDNWQLALVWNRIQTKAKIAEAIKALEYQQMEIAGE